MLNQQVAVATARTLSGHRDSGSPWGSMKLFHRTSADAAHSILSSGFKDGTGSNLTDQQYSGVWLSDGSDEQQGGVLLEVNIDLTEEQLAQYEWVEEEKNFYREWLIPAAVVNSTAVVQIAEEQE